MGVSFKLTKKGKRFRPEPSLRSDNSINEASQNSEEISPAQKRMGEDARVPPNGVGLSADYEASFTLNLYPNGYCIRKALEKEAAQKDMLQDIPQMLLPYDRTSETLFSVIDCAQLPVDLPDDIPCKYAEGTLVCEVRDYRDCGSEQGSTALHMDGYPILNKVRLKMSLGNIVKDLVMMSDDSWTYGDLMEVESRIVNAMNPKVCLDPTPKLERIHADIAPLKLNFSARERRRKRLRQMREVTFTSNDNICGKKACLAVPESSNNKSGNLGNLSGNVMRQLVNENMNQMLALRPKSFVPDACHPSVPSISQQARYQMGVGIQRSMQDHGSPAGQEMMISYTENLNSTAFHGMRESQDGPLSPLSKLNKRARLSPIGSDGTQQQQTGPSVDSLHGADLNWKNTLLQPQATARGIQYANTGIQKYPQQAFDGVQNQEAGAMPFATGQQNMRIVSQRESLDLDRLDGSDLNMGKNDMHMMGTDGNIIDAQQSQLQQRLPHHAFMRSSFPQSPWNNMVQHIDKDSRKEDQSQKRKSAQSPRLSTGALPQSPLSSKSGEFSSGSVGPQFGAVAASTVLGASQREKSAVTTVPAVSGTQSLTSSANDSMQRQHPGQVAGKWRANSLTKTPAISGVGSPASVSNMSVPLNANSPSVGTPPLAELSMLERFLKIQMVTMRYQLNSKKNKVDDYPPRKPSAYSAQNLEVCLSNVSNNEDLKDDSRPLSKSIVGGSMNNCKTRVLNFAHPERIVQGNIVSIGHRLHSRMVLLEKPNDGTVAVYYGDIDDSDILSAEDYLPTLPNTHRADLLAAQFCSLMIHEGCLVEDRIQPKPMRVNIAPSNQPNTAGTPPNNLGVEVQQYAEAVSGQTSSDVLKPTNGSNASLNSPQNLLAGARVLPPGNPQAMQMSQGLLSGVPMPARPQQLNPQPSLQTQQQPLQPQHHQLPQGQHSLLQRQQFQRTPMMLGPNPLSPLNAITQNSNMQLGNHMANKPSPLQMLQTQQQQQQPQQQTQMQRKMMMGLGTAMSMGNIGNSMAGLGGLGNAVGMGGAQGIGATGISPPMVSASNMSNMDQNSMNISQASNLSNALSQLRSGKLTPAQAALVESKLKKRAGVLGGPQSGIAGILGARQMLPGSTGLSSILGQNLNRASLNPMQRATMGPPKMTPGMNIYINQQQQQLQQQLLQQVQLPQQHMQQPQQLEMPQQHLQTQQMPQQQETATTLQAVVSASQVGSPSTMGIQQMNQQPQLQQPQQQPSPQGPQQLSQRTPVSPQMSSGAIHVISAGNHDACPASPQLSSQTLGSVGSISNSPMEIQGVNKTNSAGNA